MSVVVPDARPRAGPFARAPALAPAPAPPSSLDAAVTLDHCRSSSATSADQRTVSARGVHALRRGVPRTYQRPRRRLQLQTRRRPRKGRGALRAARSIATVQDLPRPASSCPHGTRLAPTSPRGTRHRRRLPRTRCRRRLRTRRRPPSPRMSRLQCGGGACVRHEVRRARNACWASYHRPCRRCTSSAGGATGQPNPCPCACCPLSSRRVLRLRGLAFLRSCLVSVCAVCPWHCVPHAPCCAAAEKSE